MELGFSLYLELIRFGAALLVFFGHIMGLSPAIFKLLGTWYLDHDGVVIFFVLSGYVIAYVSKEKEKDLYTYSVNRMARIYSVAAPALILALIVEYLYWVYGQAHIGTIHFGDPAISVVHQFFNITKVFFSSILFLNEIHWRDVFAFSDGPYWSLGYEVWYYILFASFFYFSGWRRWLWSAVIVLFMGIKIMLLFPVWLIGVAIYHLHQRWTIQERNAWILWVATLCIYIFMKFHNPFMNSYKWVVVPVQNLLKHPLIESSGFGWDYVMGILVGANIFAARFLKIKWILKAPVSKTIKFCASYTFSLYLYQMPVLVLVNMWVWNPMTTYHFPNTLKLIIFVATIFAVVILLGNFTERKKQVFRDWIRIGFAKFQSIRIRVRGKEAIEIT